MKDVIPAKKQSPILGLSGMGGGVGSNLGGSAAKKVYVDEVYATYTYKGDNNSGHVIINDLDFVERGGMVIQKARDYTGDWPMTDTVRGAGNMLRVNKNNANATGSGAVSAFNSNGFTIGDAGSDYNNTSYDYCSWSFCKQPGFFDIVQYSGNGAAGRQIEHNLECVPSMIWVKRLTGSENTAVWTKEFYEMNYDETSVYLETSTANGIQSNSSRFGASPTATHFTVGNDNQTNSSGGYIAYIFGGGSATSYDTTTNPLANSCQFNGSNRSLITNTNSNFTASGDWTLECWFKPLSVSGYRILLDLRGNSGGPAIYTNGSNIALDHGSAAVCATTDNPIQEYQWYHVAGTRSGNTWTLYLNGKQVAQGTNSTSYSNDADFKIGRSNIGEYFYGRISNVRYTNGEVLYTSCFRPSLEPLKSGTNTKLLCCQNSSVTGATTIPSGVTITNNNNVNLSGWTPFQDKDGNIFGSDGDENIVRSGSYIGNQDNIDIYCGFQPQLIMVKRLDGSGNWVLFDQHRNFGVWANGSSTGTSSSRMQDGANLQFNTTSHETGRGSPVSTGIRCGVTPTGFQMITETQADINGNNDKYMWFAIRDIDGKVCKPAEEAADVFAIDTGNGSGAGPNFDTRPTSTTGFIRTDMTINTNYNSTFSKRIQQRMNNKYNYGSYWSPEGTSVGSGSGGSDNYLSGVFDFEDGSNMGGWGSGTIAWMWRKSEGFATFNYEGTGVSGLRIPHDLGGVPEMIWINNRVSGDWNPVYHSGVNGGVNPENYTLQLNTTAIPYAGATYFGNTAPTEHDFTVGSNQAMNWANEHYSVAMWRSISGISKVGYYTGATAGVTVTTGFQPRFLILKSATTSSNWTVLDTTRGWGSGNDQRLYLNTTDAQSGPVTSGAPTSTGFTITNNWDTQGDTIIYYAHA